MATLQQLIDNLDRSQESEYVDIESLAQSEFRIYVSTYIGGESPLKSYWLGKWYCTDSYVGFKAYFFNDKFVCWSKQAGRKCDEDFHWKDQEIFEKVRAWCVSLLIEEKLQPDLMETDELTEELGLGFPISYSSQLLYDQVYYKDTLCAVVSCERSGYDFDKLALITINYLGYRLTVPLEETLCPWEGK